MLVDVDAVIPVVALFVDAATEVPWLAVEVVPPDPVSVGIRPEIE